jgi:hypothetical protein
MAQLTDEQKNDDLVKSLLGSGFTEEVIAGWIESGSIKLEKSVQSGPDDHGEGDGDGNHEKKEKDKDKKDPDKKKEGEGDDDSDLEKGNGCGDGDKKKDDIAKSLSDDIIKSIEDSLFGKFNQSQDDLLKSIPAIVEKALEPITDKIEKSLDGMRQAIIAFGNSAPEFKSAGLSKAIIEKSIEQGGGAKDEDNKTVLSISRDRAVVRELIAKSIDEEADPEIQKSLRDNTTAYLLDPIGGDIGKDAALYMYNKKNVRLVK